MFKIDVDKLVELLTPRFLRGQVMLAWLRSLAAPLKTIYDNFCKLRESDLLRDSTDSTVPRLEYLLNKEFYPDALNIRYYDRIRVLTVREAKVPVAYGYGLIYPLHDEMVDANREGDIFLQTREETLNLRRDFVVYVPEEKIKTNGTTETFNIDETRMRSMVTSFALPDKRFDIVRSRQNIVEE